MRILIVGAGVAGLSLAALLKQRGISPVVIEKAESLGRVGYMLGLYPTGANVLRALQCYDHYLKVSSPGKLYEAYTDNADLLKQFSFAPLVKRYGAYQLLTRYELLDIIHNVCGDLDIRFNTRVNSLKQTEQDVFIEFSDKTQETYDLVVGADGLHSQIRTMILGDHEYRYFHTGWGGWVWWANEDSLPDNTIQEFWGSGTFWGGYPIKGKVGMIAAVDAPTDELALQGCGRKAFIEKKFASLLRHRPEFLKDLPTDDQAVFYWPLSDQRTKTWHKGRVVLLGDSAAAFLPTAGVGASMALESAAVLNDVLSRTGVEFIPQALHLFEKRRRPRVEAAQSDSRGLAKMMFINSPLKARIRNYLTKIMSVESLLKSIMKGFDDPV
ncbi:FAD-dependent oxidoreductase [Legionella spiritensis]|uniref:Oxidoreductase n=1 Tax=Legionella spiritensis TaxID=452 RepID=A0A0W0YWP2_LEGSP|nr:NAD(P)/FAD-dependent oxidoreductase [Legionella spiritensis]KTD61103.1 oxidoreductase [Legionella spiritensis]SNV44914.1 oxidoreductase [Legionella spiritensis]